MFRATTLLFLSFMLIGFSITAQNETMVTVKGKLLSARDSSAISTTILYEKLPYYDDMGIASANGTGDFSFMIVKGVSYNISIRKDSFRALNQEVVANDSDNDLTEEFRFYMDPDFVEDEVFTLNNVIFSRGSEELQSESFAELDRLIARMKENTAMVIQLEGHTDFAGNPDANMALSQARVESVKKHLTKGGIRPERILTKAFGGSKPLSEERTPEAMAINRRVEVRVVKK